MNSIPLPVQFRNGYAVAVQPAEIDVINASMVGDTLLALLNCGTPGVVADMAGTRFCDLAGMRAIVRAQRRAQAVGARLGVVIPRPAAHRVFTLTGADALIRFFPSLEVALAVLPATTADHGTGRLAPDHGRMTGQPDRLRLVAFPGRPDQVTGSRGREEISCLGTPSRGRSPTVSCSNGCAGWHAEAPNVRRSAKSW